MVDVDNCIKTCQDLIVLLNYLKDDRLIVELCARKKSAKKREEKIEIIIKEII